VSRYQAAKDPSPATAYPSPGSTLPPHYTPRVAGYARGPFIEPAHVIPTDWRWRDAPTVVVIGADGQEFRCVPVHSAGALVGYWAVERLGVPLPPNEWK
jgi:hypothetical protein